MEAAPDLSTDTRSKLAPTATDSSPRLTARVRGVHGDGMQGCDPQATVCVFHRIHSNTQKQISLVNDRWPADQGRDAARTDARGTKRSIHLKNTVDTRSSAVPAMRPSGMIHHPSNS
jgi:hypothetical protein